MSIKVYEYKNCSTCKKALKFLEDRKVSFERIPIVDQPPTLTELKKMLSFVKGSGGSIRNLFNTSGELYRSFKVSEKLKSGMSETDALNLLAAHGKLVKRPFLLSDRGGLLGFKPDEWSSFLTSSKSN